MTSVMAAGTRAKKRLKATAAASTPGPAAANLRQKRIGVELAMFLSGSTTRAQVRKGRPGVRRHPNTLEEPGRGYTARMRRILAVAIVTLAGASVLVGLYVVGSSSAEPVTVATTFPSTTTTSAAPATTTVPSTTTTTTTPFVRFVDPRTVGTPWGSTAGILQFRGNPSRTWYGPSHLPDNPQRLWRFPDSGMCGSSSVGGETTNWCGTGWTGQPAIWIRPDGITEVVFGAYDKAVHFVNASTEERTRPDFQVGDLIKGSVTIDPDGYPLLYFGSRDNKLRVVALDREQPIELWAIDAADHPGVWNNDWDGNPSIVEDIMFEGGENGILFATKLNRRYDANGIVQVDPEILVKVEGWSDELFRSVGDRNASIESSVAILNGRLYFTNSGGRVVGLDITNVETGEAPIIFDFWAGDDIDASPVLDADGMVYLAIELERRLPLCRSGESQTRPVCPR